MYAEEHQRGAPHGLLMLTTGSERLDIPVNDNVIYDYLHSAGQGVQVYIMDTGVRISHKLFEGRARNFGDLAPTDKSPYVDETMDDTNSHGTQ
jgi:subtilisin family serine protease